MFKGSCRWCSNCEQPEEGIFYCYIKDVWMKRPQIIVLRQCDSFNESDYSVDDQTESESCKHKRLIALYERRKAGDWS